MAENAADNVGDNVADNVGDNAIHGTEWTVQELGGEVTALPKPQLSFGADGRLTGTTGVNRLMGEFEVRDGLLVVGNAATTRMAGPPEAMAQEQRLLELLGAEQAFVITGDRLEIGDGETAALLVRPSIQPVPVVDAGEDNAAGGAGAPGTT
ncbi:META domain-containing protein [Humibacillus xanthopallidus]|uniref:Heat shock protein HslJ n=1 Tax=Humibacillus xanthopallidus TaxID=412689 RepID=A0A543HFV2_9MICO|nr:META domain-containing protein [Humibacillus xanthopallidus]TQM57200.1 heat shock protein HslJ [Humibacillus xanthopallidus]